MLNLWPSPTEEDIYDIKIVCDCCDTSETFAGVKCIVSNFANDIDIIDDQIAESGWTRENGKYLCKACNDKIKADVVNHPSHYISESGLESIDVIKAFTSYEDYATGNILKYVMRWRSKNGVEDLKKARWYIDDLIKEVEKND